MQLFTKPTDKTLVLNVSLNSKISEIKRIISKKINVPVKYINLTHVGKKMDDDKTVKYYNIHNNANIWTTFKVF